MGKQALAIDSTAPHNAFAVRVAALPDQLEAGMACELHGGDLELARHYPLLQRRVR